MTFRFPYAEEFFDGVIQILSIFHGLHQHSSGSALLCPFRVNMTTLQNSLYVTDYYFALLSQEVTPLQHISSPLCTGSLLHGSLAITMTRLSLASKLCLARHTKCIVIGWMRPHEARVRQDVAPLSTFRLSTAPKN